MDLVLPRWFIADENKESYFYARMWYGEDDYITQSVKHGVGIHFGDMPEQVRNSVEHDYRSGKLRVLLSSNTVGQGLNFPIKNLIFYNLAIGQDGWKQIFISNRDFWNIVGRAGRAGKETEGKILFVISTPNDQKIYKNFTNRSNLEEADSLFSKVFKAYNNGQVSGRQRDRQLAILSETYLMEMFAEEIVGTDFEEIINKIINNSLFKIQIDEDDIELIKNSFRRTFAKFENELNIEDAAVYKLSGFSYDSNLVIDEFIVGNLEVLNELINSDDYLGYLKLVWQFLLESDIEELKDPKLNNIGLSTDIHFTAMELWISGTPLEVIITQWKKTHTIEQFHLFLSKGLYYLYPWALTAFMNILSYRLEIDADELPYNISNLPSYLKYGLPDTAGCLARSLGIKNRDAVNQLIPLAKDKDGADFIKWLSNLSLIKIRDLDLSTFDEENIINVCRRLTPNRFNKLPEVLTFTIEGTEDYTSWSRRSLLVVEGSRIKYRRLRNRSKDPYAIYLYYGMRIIGRVPSQYIKILSSEIDINGTDYVIKAVKVVQQTQHTIITVEMTIDDLL